MPEKLPLGIKFYGKIKSQILYYVHKAGKHGIASESLFQALYGDDPNGGPEYGRNTLAVHVSQMNVELKKQGWHIWNNHVGRGLGGNYILEEIK
ncbi:MAG: hypothetical protein KGL39_23865 [Patescibacteria group bacterium]|nr:hypothetical protein [Patescibacteria group bacterium]